VERTLTTTDLERQSGLPRSTIQFYTRLGLVPPPQKTTTGRSLYGEVHLHMLDRIRELKRTGASLADIAAELHRTYPEATVETLDLERLEYERVHSAILQAATREFVDKGYKRTHVSAIIRECGISPTGFYQHFPSKVHLMVEALKTFVELNISFVEPVATASPDPGERALRRVHADHWVNELGSEVLSAIRAHGERLDSDAYRLSDAWRAIVDSISEDFREQRPQRCDPPRVSDELIAYALMGAHRNVRLRASLDDSFTTADVLRAHLFLYLAVLAAVSGEVDIYSRLARYEDLIQELASRTADLPPALRQQASDSRHASTKPRLSP